MEELEPTIKSERKPDGTLLLYLCWIFSTPSSKTVQGLTREIGKQYNGANTGGWMESIDRQVKGFDASARLRNVRIAHRHVGAEGQTLSVNCEN